MTRSTDAAALRIERQQYREARALLGQLAAHLGVEDGDPAALLLAAEMSTIGMNAMCKDWNELAAEVAAMRRQLAEAQKENALLRAMLEVADARINKLIGEKNENR